MWIKTEKGNYVNLSQCEEIRIENRHIIAYFDADREHTWAFVSEKEKESFLNRLDEILRIRK